ncbi:hypothetical protein BJ508DRAFT_309380 [Ascobolus immersus RN42]|uniref:Uncharacterized protein n=1 Tax=Ascobolus immersus RN42 TaxID=1160509 RepID=A0A3N4HWL9_ASCIM|nr:hypothetical protein BJ508DRAFT_309380 [Ascobolus immersus RN42]
MARRCELPERDPCSDFDNAKTKLKKISLYISALKRQDGYTTKELQLAPKLEEKRDMLQARLERITGEYIVVTAKCREDVDNSEIRHSVNTITQAQFQKLGETCASLLSQHRVIGQDLQGLLKDCTETAEKAKADITRRNKSLVERFSKVDLDEISRRSAGIWNTFDQIKGASKELHSTKYCSPTLLADLGTSSLFELSKSVGAVAARGHENLKLLESCRVILEEQKQKYIEHGELDLNTMLSRDLEEIFISARRALESWEEGLTLLERFAVPFLLECEKVLNRVEEFKAMGKSGKGTVETLTKVDAGELMIRASGFLGKPMSEVSGDSDLSASDERS